MQSAEMAFRVFKNSYVKHDVHVCMGTFSENSIALIRHLQGF